MATQNHVEYHIEGKCLYEKEMESRQNGVIGKPPSMTHH